VSEQQRLFPVLRVGLDRTQENDVVAAIVPIDGAALKTCTVRKDWRVAEAGVHSTPANLSSEDFAKLVASACFEAPDTAGTPTAMKGHGALIAGHWAERRWAKPRSALVQRKRTWPRQFDLLG
jgi:hypothetical protein